MTESAPTRRVLHVGCGNTTLKNLPLPFQDGTWVEVRLDIDPSCSPDIIGTIVDMKGVETGSMDAVFSSHNIEHVFPHEVPIALGEFARVLKADGFALVTCPDLQSLGEAIAAGRVDEPIYMSPAGPIAPLDIIFGHRGSVARGKHYMAHRCGFTGRTLAESLTAAGFASVGVRAKREGCVNLWAVATRNRVAAETITSMLDRYTHHRR